MSKKVDPSSVRTVTGSLYPSPYDVPCATRVRRRLGDAAGLAQFGVNLTRLPAGAWSSQRHWHSAEDEFIYVLEGELVLVTDGGEEILRAGDCAGFQGGTPDGHQLQNRSGKDAVYLEIGSRRIEHDEVSYPDIDLRSPKGRGGFTHTDGRPYGVKTGS
jgi:uncharacterized cupin superfamily protein